MPFDLEGALKIDYSALDEMQTEIEARTEGVKADIEATATVEVDTRRADAGLRETAALADDLTTAINRPKSVNIDTADALSQLSAVETRWDKITESMPQAIVGATLMGAGGYVAGKITASSLSAANAEAMMAKSTRMVFGTAADEYEDQAKALADSTGFMVAELEQAQIAFNKMAISLGMENTPQKPLTQLATDLAANTGLPQYANNIQAVTSAVASGIGGTADALLDFGIRLDDAYVLSLKANEGFAAMGEAITPAQMAQARYNALMEQTAEIYGTAGETADDYGASMRRFQQSLQGAKASVGEVLLPIANTIADFVANMPKPLLKAGIWAGIGIGLASTVAGAVIAIASLKRAVQDLGIAAGSSAVATSAAATATNTTTSATGKLSGGVGNLGKAAGVAAIGVPLLVDAINQLISGLQNEENYYENSYTEMLNTIQDDEGGPGWWDKILTYSKKGALGPGFAAVAHALGPTETEMNKEWAEVGGPKQADTLFHGWLADAMGMTGSQRAEFKSAPLPTYVDLPGGAIKPEPFTYEGLKEWWQTNQMDTIKQSGVEVLVPAVTIKVENNTDAIIATDLNSYTESIY